MGESELRPPQKESAPKKLLSREMMATGSGASGVYRRDPVQTKRDTVQTRDIKLTGNLHPMLLSTFQFMCRLDVVAQR